MGPWLHIFKSTSIDDRHPRQLIMGGSSAWKKTEEWRKHPKLNNNMRHIFPGFAIAVVAFAGYVAYDKFVATPEKYHH